MSKDCWDKAEIVAKIFAGVGIALLVLVVNRSQQEKAQQQRYIEIAVSILKADPTKGPTDDPLRDWAIAILKRYTPIPLSDPALKALRERPLPSSDTVRLSGASARTETGQLSVTVGPPSGEGGISGVGAQAQPGQLSVGTSTRTREPRK